jgi:hypothetical protein
LSDSVNGVSNSYKYLNSELKKYDTDEDGSLSVFEIENITDDEGIELLSNDLELQTQNINEEDDEEFEELDLNSQIEALETQLEEVKNEQGIISSAWNAVKSFTGLGTSTKKCEQAIEDFKNGTITYDEASNIISKFQTKQESSVNLVSNIVTGVASVAVVGSAVATGGLSLGVIAAAAGVGAATKTGLKFIDRATNKVEGDALDGKQLAKDALSGALDGGVSAVTMGLGTTSVTTKTVAEQSLKETVIKGTISGAKIGGFSGAITGAGNYAIDSALEDDVDFSAEDLAKTTISTAFGGALTGGVIGGITSGIQYSSAEKLLAKRIKDEPTLSQDEIVEMGEQANKINSKCESQITEAKEQIEGVFDENSSVEKITARAKSSDSVYEKLVKKFKNGKIETLDDENCYNAIADGLGTRVQIKSLTNEEAEEIIKESLKDTNVTYQQFLDFMDDDLSSLDDIAINSIEETSKNVLNNLKEAQTKEVYESLISGIESGKITITELNNYGDDISSYFTQSQLDEIARVYKETTGKALDIVTKMDDSYAQASANIEVDSNGEIVQNKSVDNAIYSEKGAIKDSGYASSQMNTIHTFKDGSTGLGELQIRGTELNEFADVEHIPYDIKQKKITEADTEYSDVFKIISKFDDSTFTSYNKYMTKVYNWLRLKELGIETTEPSIQTMLKDTNLSDDALSLISREGLTNLWKSLH